MIFNQQTLIKEGRGQKAEGFLMKFQKIYSHKMAETVACFPASPRLRVSASPHLPISPSPHLPISPSPRPRVLLPPTNFFSRFIP
ncbi:MAG: hypothetical protein F6K39_04970 [Okeania sp. SIO3B3]|nr:hypothetical protein [Okeania sp. SIO3B3]